MLQCPRHPKLNRLNEGFTGNNKINNGALFYCAVEGTSLFVITILKRCVIGSRKICFVKRCKLINLLTPPLLVRCKCVNSNMC